MATLSIKGAPPPDDPIRYLWAVPAWGLFAALLIAWHGAEIVVSRWAPATIALIHAFTLGVLGNAIFGSLLQFLPVAAGFKLHRFRRGEAALHRGYNIGVVAMIAGLLLWPQVLVLGGVLVATSMAVHALRGLWGFRWDGHQRVLRVGLAGALLALLATAGLGLALCLARAGVVSLPPLVTVDLHAAIAVVGAVTLLTAAVGSVVMPMFQGTASIQPRTLACWIATLVLALVAGAIFRVAGDAGRLGLLLTIPLSLFGLYILVAHARSPRRRNPALRGFWKFGATALVAGSLAAVLASVTGSATGTLLAGALVIAVGLPALVTGMLLEIVAFLAWLDLQRRHVKRRGLPSVDQLLSETAKRRVLWLHMTAGIALMLAVGWPHRLSSTFAAVALFAAYAMQLRAQWKVVSRAQDVSRSVA